MENEPKKRTKDEEDKDGRGVRPTDPNQLGKWIVDQATKDKSGDRQEKT